MRCKSTSQKLQGTTKYVSMCAARAIAEHGTDLGQALGHVLKTVDKIVCVLTLLTYQLNKLAASCGSSLQQKVVQIQTQSLLFAT